ncbi:cyclic nucleotide-binding domain-containing protein [Mucilaginibacter sp. PPCGB 2223]|nr:cyclic nucleotide-binding domain-containing protein [Mucilaginibacter sp. PPCGB 2223]
MGTYLLEEEFKKKTLLLQAGQVAQRIYFIRKGFLRSYFYKEADQ